MDRRPPQATAARVNVSQANIGRANTPASLTIPKRLKPNMNDLLNTALTAHGGLERWGEISLITAQASIGGSLWPAKGKGGILDNVQVRLDPHTQRVEYAPFGAVGRHSVYEPTRVAIESDAGQILLDRSEPRAAFKTHVRETQWDDLDLVYFSGYAIWTYLTTPFLFTLPGFESEEITPWQEEGEVWRRLQVTFPASIPSHSREQTFYFNRDGILRRHDYTADILGGLPSANYMDHRNFAGLVVPTRRRVFARAPDGRPVRDGSLSLSTSTP
jgi:hypothetical protein